MKTTIYIPIHIEGKEENLPKEAGVYHVIKNDFEISIKHFGDDDLFKETHYYLNYVRAWLKPVVLPDDDEMNEEANLYAEIAKQDFGVKENASLDFLRGASWLKSQILNK